MAASAKTHVSQDALNGEWTVVSSRRRRQRRNPPVLKNLVEKQQQQKNWAPTDIEINFDRESKLMQKIQICMKKLELSQFFLKLLDQMQTDEMMNCFHRVLSSELKMKMVMYGIGSIESYESPRLQLSLAILLKRRFNWIGDIEVFDPILSSTESRVLEALGCSMLSINEQGRRVAQKPTIFFMPHCEAELYDNLLQTNWGMKQLNCIVLFGNSFQTYEQHLLEFKNSAIIHSTKYVLAARKFTNEFSIETVSDDYFGAFHDSSWQFFSPDLESELQLNNC
ncbi:protein SENSITIVITY TO RED LIGHT REDUCED 1 [Argentina anserina]|uniref:protein SENSITIVITY TO RED LIGHT REDUCED 1 n=1 Tax=Argentina anserina TaxID=57926 RepID=UPI0021765C86|nr:protein SENSITIVITY TO RED LIGHT REDUCED 1 [Potentilla anserina]XP_050376641.1 protein SENSITIVITY TO RED LIGHT REDUCED 1 [Potentilla anserina]XP_050376642.1 protein SENSITIVITY TO RED LIGHT REDUCED 1 [Potentilla anserina]XP_050376643.1 protein SENSITIVITY TO RED LIGHT REDUCED 1 [Potentilla anserina]